MTENERVMSPAAGRQGPAEHDVIVPCHEEAFRARSSRGSGSSRVTSTYARMRPFGKRRSGCG